MIAGDLHAVAFFNGLRSRPAITDAVSDASAVEEKNCNLI